MYFDNLKIYSTKKGWKIYNVDQNKFSKIIKKYPTELSEKHILLTENETQDRIEILIEFLTEINNNKI